MQLTRIHIENYRCLKTVDIELEPATVLVGANGTGKSSVLHALQWFFSGGDIELEDVTGKEPGQTTRVVATFDGFGDADRETLGRYVEGDQALFERRWSQDEGSVLTGRSLALPAFEAVRGMTSATEKRAEYAKIREAHPEYDLPTAASAQAVLDAMEGWERANPDALTPSSVSATHLFGAVGGARLAGRFDYVLIPAVADVDRETRDARGTLLRQLLDRFVAARPEIRERLAEVTGDARARINEIMRDGVSGDLLTLADRLSVDLDLLVPGTRVMLQALPIDLSTPTSSVGLTVSDGGLETDVDHQGHGVQRSLFMAMVQHLSNADLPDDSGNPSQVLLAIEEPELFQHPLQARHLAKTLSGLAAGESGVQVIYATHSEHFVAQASFTAIRRFQRDPAGGAGISAISQASLDRVAERLSAVMDRDHILTRVRIAMARGLEQAVFAKAAVVVEGVTDAALLEGLGERVGKAFDALGIAFVPTNGKTRLLLPWAILEELGVRTYVIFDGDAGLRHSHGPEHAKVIDSQRWNKAILDALGHEPNPQPPTTVTDSFACYEDTLETELGQWLDFEVQRERVVSDQGDYRDKSDDAYRAAAASAAGPVPGVFSDLLTAITGLIE
jgi:hypothetical protein